MGATTHFVNSPISGPTAQLFFTCSTILFLASVTSTSTVTKFQWIWRKNQTAHSCFTGHLRGLCKWNCCRYVARNGTRKKEPPSFVHLAALITWPGRLTGTAAPGTDGRGQTVGGHWAEFGRGYSDVMASQPESSGRGSDIFPYKSIIGRCSWINCVCRCFLASTCILEKMIFSFKFDQKLDPNEWNLIFEKYFKVKKKENEAEDNKVMERGRFVGGWQRRRVRFTGPVPKTPAADEQSLISSCFCLLWGQNRFFYNQRHYWIPFSLFLVMHLITCCSLNIETLGDVIFLFIEFKKKTVRIKVDGVTSLRLIIC